MNNHNRYANRPFRYINNSMRIIIIKYPVVFLYKFIKLKSNFKVLMNLLDKPEIVFNQTIIEVR